MWCNYLPSQLITLAFDLSKRVVNPFTRFRMGLSITEPHKNRYKCLSSEKLLCPMCKTSVETDIHFLLVCSAYEDLRAQSIPPEYFRNPCLFRFVSPRKTHDQEHLRNLAIFFFIRPRTERKEYVANLKTFF